METSYVQYDWREDAACNNLNTPVNFFPHADDAVAIAQAKSVCEECPVRQQCHIMAVAFPNTVGVFGGEFFELKEEDETGIVEATQKPKKQNRKS